MRLPLHVANDRDGLVTALARAAEATWSSSTRRALGRRGHRGPGALLRTIPGVELHLALSAASGPRDMRAPRDGSGTSGQPPAVHQAGRGRRPGEPAGGGPGLASPRVVHRRRTARPDDLHAVTSASLATSWSGRGTRDQTPTCAAQGANDVDQAQSLRNLIGGPGGGATSPSRRPPGLACASSPSPAARAASARPTSPPTWRCWRRAWANACSSSTGTWAWPTSRSCSASSPATTWATSLSGAAQRLRGAGRRPARCPHPAGRLGVQALTQLDEAEKLRLCTALDELEDSFDIVLIDSGAGIGDNVMFFVSAAHEALRWSARADLAGRRLRRGQGAVAAGGRAPLRRGREPRRRRAAARDIFPKLTTVTNRFLSASVRHLATCRATRTCTAASWPRSAGRARWPTGTGW